MESQHAGRTYVITGAGGGIGRACAIILGSRGANILCADVNLAGAEETCAMVHEASKRVGIAQPCSVDVTLEKSVDTMIEIATRSFGKLDGAINAAGIEGNRACVHESSLDNWERVIGVNATGVFNCMRAEVSAMLQQGAFGTAAVATSSLRSAPIDLLNYSIVNISSSAGLAGMPEFAAYSASKHAIIGLTRSAAKEYASKGIRVNAICPSTTDTPMVARFAERWPEWQASQNASFPVRRIGSPDEVAATAAFLLSADCPMMSGTALTIDGALSS